MWLLFVAVGSGYLARCWRNGVQDSPCKEEEEEKELKTEERTFRRHRGWVINNDQKRRRNVKKCKEVWQSGRGFKRGDLNAVEQQKEMEKINGSQRRTSKRLFEEDVSNCISTVRTGQESIQTHASEDSSRQLEESSAKRTIEFGDLEEAKRMRDSNELKDGGSFTCSFVENPAVSDLWFPQHGIRGNGIKSSRTVNRGRARGVYRRNRYLRSPKPVSSLESCLRAQLRFEEDKRVSRSLFFQNFEVGRSPGLGEVESLQVSEEFSSYTSLRPLRRPKSRHALNRSQEAFLFSFGVGVGILHTLTSNKAEIERLRSCLQEAERRVQELQQSKQILLEQMNLGDRTVQFFSNAVQPVEQQDIMEELEAQLEAELELMQLQSSEQPQSSELDEEDIGEVVHDELHATGLPAVCDLENEREQSEHADGNAKNSWAVSPRELDKRLRMLLQTRQEERIGELEEQLGHAENQLQERERELEMWKDRVRALNEITLPTSGERYEESHETNAEPESAREQSPTDDICDEFLKSVLEETTKEGAELEETQDKHTHSNPDIPIPSRAFIAGSYMQHAGASTPVEEVRVDKLFNTPRKNADTRRTSVTDRIKYWENIAKNSSAASTPGGSSQGNLHQQAGSPLRFSCSEFEEGSSCDETSSVSESEDHVMGDVLIRRIVEKSRKGSNLLKDVQMMLAALEAS